MKKHEYLQHVGIDRTVLQVSPRARASRPDVQQNVRIAVVCKTAAACEVNQDGAGEREQQKCDINIPAPLQRPADHRSSPRSAAPCRRPARKLCPIGTRIFPRHRRSRVPQRQPTSDVVGNMVENIDHSAMPRQASIRRSRASSAPEARRPITWEWRFDRASGFSQAGKLDLPLEVLM